MYEKKKNIVFFANGKILRHEIVPFVDRLRLFLKDNRDHAEQVEVRVFHTVRDFKNYRLPFVKSIAVGMEGHDDPTSEEIDMVMVSNMSLYAERNPHFTHMFILSKETAPSPAYQTVITHLGNIFRSKQSRIERVLVETDPLVYLPSLPFCATCKKKFRTEERLEQHKAAKHNHAGG
jgi:hypothetical protein